MGFKPDCTTSKNTMMPRYPKGVSAYPNHLARSALFSPIKKGARKLLENEKIASRDDANIFFSGKQLDMGDCDVFLQVIKIAEGRQAGEEIMLNRAEFLTAIGRKLGSSSYTWLLKSLERLHNAKLRVESKKYFVSMYLIASYGVDKQTGGFYVQFSQEILPLFRKEFAYIDMQKRVTLKNDFTKWLQGYIASHEKGLHKIAVEKLHCWSGSNMILKDWKFTKLKPALAELENMGIIKKTKVTHLVEWIKL